MIGAIKANQDRLRDELEFKINVDQQQNFKDAPYDYVRMVNRGQGRIETRRCWQASDKEYLSHILKNGLD